MITGIRKANSVMKSQRPRGFSPSIMSIASARIFGMRSVTVLRDSACSSTAVFHVLGRIGEHRHEALPLGRVVLHRQLQDLAGKALVVAEHLLGEIAVRRVPMAAVIGRPEHRRRALFQGIELDEESEPRGPGSNTS